MKDTIHQNISHLARKAGDIIRSGYENRTQVTQKGMIDLVTETDFASESFIMNGLRAAYPDATILAEESGLHETSGQLRFVIDPLDGTVNFAHGIPYFCVLISAQQKDASGAYITTASVTYDPMRDELFMALKDGGATRNEQAIHVSKVNSLMQSLLVTGFGYERLYSQPDNHREFCRLNLLSQGVRRFGSAGLDMAYVACGRLDGYWEYGLNPWDKAAGILLIQEAGGTVTTMAGETADCDSPEVVAAGLNLHPLLRQALCSAQQEAINSRDGLEAFLPDDAAQKLRENKRQGIEWQSIK